jgi:hypothetical protein
MGRQIVSPECAPLVGYNDFAPAIGVWDWDLASNVIYGDDAVAKVFGLDSSLTKKGLSPEDYFGAIHQDDRQMIIDHSRRSIATNGACSDNFRIVSPLGVKWVNSQGRAFADRQNNPRCFVGLISEIAPQNGFDHAETSIFPGGSADDDVLYLCIHAKRIAMHAKRPFLEYLLEMVMAEVTDSRVMHKC